MRQESSKNSIQIKSTSQKEHDLTIHEYSRWLCLIEALDHVSVRAKQLKHDMEKTSDWIKPLSFQKYIVERYETMIEEVAGFEKMTFEINTIEPKLCTTLLKPVLCTTLEPIDLELTDTLESDLCTTLLAPILQSIEEKT